MSQKSNSFQTFVQILTPLFSYALSSIIRHQNTHLAHIRVTRTPKLSIFYVLVKFHDLEAANFTNIYPFDEIIADPESSHRKYLAGGSYVLRNSELVNLTFSVLANPRQNLAKSVYWGHNSTTTHLNYAYDTSNDAEFNYASFEYA